VSFGDALEGRFRERRRAALRARPAFRSSRLAPRGAGRGRAGGERRPWIRSYPSRPARPLAERDRIIAAMEESGWVQAKAARLLGLTPRQIRYALKK
jgi:transcriptional regulator with GAF, ATPase, and Fis domain